MFEPGAASGHDCIGADFGEGTGFGKKTTNQGLPGAVNRFKKAPASQTGI